MSRPTAALEVTVPGSTSNLGPGYDLVGLALSLELRVGAEHRGPGASAHDERRGEAAAWPEGDDDLLRTAFARTAGARAAAEWSFAVDSEIPAARGFGSSGAAIAAGLLLGAAAGGAEADDGALLAAGITLEGHPENVCASLFGGCTLTLARRSEPPLVLAQEVHPSLAFAVAWPDLPMSTARARAALPAALPHADAVASAHGVAALLRGLAEGRRDLLRLAEDDRLHVPHRLPLLPGAERALAAAREAGAWLATISGSGSGLLAVADAGRVAGVAAALAETLHEETGTGTGRVVTAVRERPRVRPRE